MCCGNDNKDGGLIMADGARYSVFYIHPNRGKHMVTGAETKEKIGYIAYGSYIDNVHESDIAVMAGQFVCGICQKPFTVSGKQSWCNTCYPPQQRPTPTLGQLQPRSAQQRLTASGKAAHEKWSQPHKNFQDQTDPWAEQQQSPQQMPQYTPQQGFAAQQPQQVPQYQPPQPAPIPPQEVKEVDDPKSVASAARQTKEASFGIPVAEPNVIGPPPAFNQNAPVAAEGVNNARISDIDFGRSVNKRHKQILADNGVVTLSDAVNRGKSGLESISGIGGAVANAVMRATGGQVTPT